MSTRTAVGGVVSYSIKSNTFGDCLPIIPSESFVAFGSVLFRIDFEIAITMNGKPVPALCLPFWASGVHSKAKMLQPTNDLGVSTLRLETRYAGRSTVSPAAPEFKHSAFDVDISEAWYEAPFLITAYNCCDEDEFHGPLVEANGVGPHKRDFLFSGKGIVMEGTGRGSDGRFIQIANPAAIKWNPGYNGVANPAEAIFEYVDAPEGAFGPIVQNCSIAVDPAILPPLHRVHIEGTRQLGERRGDDSGGAIRGFHFDHFVGAGSKVMQAWEQAGGNLMQARVKYLGV